MTLIAVYDDATNHQVEHRDFPGPEECAEFIKQIERSHSIKHSKPPIRYIIETART